eukprot:scaffold29703_cov68-Phaeocystis_antarctica.AAC.1
MISPKDLVRVRVRVRVRALNGGTAASRGDLGGSGSPSRVRRATASTPGGSVRGGPGCHRAAELRRCQGAALGHGRLPDVGAVGVVAAVEPLRSLVR